MKLKTLLPIMLIAGIVTACDSTKVLEDGKPHACVGAFSDEDREPNVRYRVSENNVVVGVIFVETLYVPAVVLLSETYCPISLRTPDTTAVHRDTIHAK